jgi:predicted GIY-YIG superfamily endonuclease
MRKSGIYLITNTVNGKVYVGQSINLQGRLWSHLSKLRKGTHHNRHLLAAVKKYGIEKFTFEVLCECSVEELDQKEQRYLDLLKSYDREIGYNVCPIAVNPLKNCTDETRALHSAQMVNYWKECSDEEKKERLQGTVEFWEKNSKKRTALQVAGAERLKTWKRQLTQEEQEALYTKTVQAQREGIKNYRVSLTEEDKERLTQIGRDVAARREAAMTEEQRELRSEIASAKQRAYWASLTDEEKEKQNKAKSKALKGRKKVFSTPDGESPLLGVYWYNNGVIELRAKPSEVAEGFARGRL